MQEYLKNRRDTDDHVELTQSNFQVCEKEKNPTQNVLENEIRMNSLLTKNYTTNKLEASNSTDILDEDDEDRQNKNKLNITNLKNNDLKHVQISNSITTKYNEEYVNKDDESSQMFVYPPSFPNQEEKVEGQILDSRIAPRNSIQSRHSTVEEEPGIYQGKTESSKNISNITYNQEEEEQQCDVDKRGNAQDEENEQKDEDNPMFPIRRRLNAMSETRPHLKRVSFQSLDLGKLRNSQHFSKDVLNSI